MRDAAIDLFGRVGFERTTVREVAAAAEVSPALVIHHFASKEGLRAACDEHVTSLLFDTKNELLGTDAAAIMRSWFDDFDQFRPLLRYIAHMLIAGSAAGRSLFTAILTGTRRMIDAQIEAGVMRDIPDRDTVAAYLTAQGLAPLLLQEHLAGAFDAPEMTADLYRRSAVPLLDLYTHGLYTDDRLLRMAENALREDLP
jgi:AcrR family transcriptional regulator